MFSSKLKWIRSIKLSMFSTSHVKWDGIRISRIYHEHTENKAYWQKLQHYRKQMGN